MIKFSPQHFLSDGVLGCLFYYKASYDDRYVELLRREVAAIRLWHQNVHPTVVFVFNYRMDRYTILTVEMLNRTLFSCRKDNIDHYLIDNETLTWHCSTERLELKNYGRVLNEQGEKHR